MPNLSSFIYVDGLLFTVDEGGVAMCLDAPTGEVVWQERLEATYSASPVYADGKIYMLSEGGETTVIEAGREFKELARNPLDETCQASPAVSGGRTFIRSAKHLFCIQEAEN